MSCPLVAGASALYLEVNPMGWPEDVLERLEDTADPFVGEQGSIWEGKMGDGRLDVAELVQN